MKKGIIFVPAVQRSLHGRSTSFSTADLYIGAKAGVGEVSNACFNSTSDCDDKSATGGVYLGYEFNEFVDAEVAYDHLGKYKGSFEQPDISPKTRK